MFSAYCISNIRISYNSMDVHHAYLNFRYLTLRVQELPESHRWACFVWNRLEQEYAVPKRANSHSFLD